MLSKRQFKEMLWRTHRKQLAGMLVLVSSPVARLESQSKAADGTSSKVIGNPKPAPTSHRGSRNLRRPWHLRRTGRKAYRSRQRLGFAGALALWRPFPSYVRTVIVG